MSECLDCALDECDTCAMNDHEEYYGGGCCCGRIRPAPTPPPAAAVVRAESETEGDQA